MRKQAPSTASEIDTLYQKLGGELVASELAKKSSDIADIFKKVEAGSLDAEKAFEKIKTAQDGLIKQESLNGVEKLQQKLKETFGAKKTTN